MTDNFVSSDIKLIIDEIARSLRKERGRITMEILENKIKTTKPSVKIQVLRKHEDIRKGFESDKNKTNEQKRIGFKP
jgi:SpoVK/Ycf46/Vps4 family AAA+-type ATPase